MPFRKLENVEWASVCFISEKLRYGLLKKVWSLEGFIFIFQRTYW